MELPIQFPREADKIHQAAQRFRRLAPDQRVRTLLDLIAAGAIILEQSPKGDVSQRLRRENEEAWRNTQRKLFARHAT